MAVRGSTAPAITSPLLAWPAKPTPRSTPLVTPVTGTFESFDFPTRTIPTDTFGLAHSTSKMKGKEKAEAIEEVEVEDPEAEQGEKKYRPPTKPLSPRQLGRIAQSFGIEVPSTMLPGSSSGQEHSRSLSPAGSSTAQPTRPSPFLLTVIPPISLLPPSTSSTGAESARKWRRGRLIPLQPTVGAMLVAIAREYGLPSTKGINLYIAQAPKPSSSSSVFSDISDETGPRISPATWTSLFASQVMSLSRSSTPTGSPRRTGQLFKRDQQASSPLSPWTDVLPHPRAPFGASSSSARSTPTKLSVLDQSGSLTPSSTHSQTSSSAIIATIEFDIDPEEGTWYTSFNASGRRKNLSTRSEGGVRELHLVSKANDARPRFLRDVDVNISSDFSCSTGDSSMIKTVEDSHETEGPPSPRQRGENLLAPFELQPDIGDVLDKRGSALVIGEQLDDLEKMMRQLSPREIRLTSPRELTPRMAAKVATLQFPPPLPPRNANRPAKSPLVNSFTEQFPNSGKKAPPALPPRPAWPAVPFDKHSESPGSPQLDEYFRPPTRPSADGNGSRKSSFSEETMKRMEAERQDPEASRPMTTEWKPRRPVRPPSPNISSGTHASTPSYSLSPELVSSLKSPTASAPKSPEGESGEKRRTRSNSISLKGLRASMSKSTNRSSKKEEREHVPDLPRESKEGRETYGLFRQPIESTSSFPGLEGRPSLSTSISEFGSVDTSSTLPTQEVQSTASLPNKQSGMRRLFGGSLPFKTRSSSDTHTTTLSQIAPQGQQRTSLKSRRNPIHDGANLTISPPIPESFHKADNGFPHPTTVIHEDGRNTYEPGNGPMTPPYRYANGPVSPASPRNGKRKPVPGVGAGELEYMVDTNAPNQAAAGLTGSVSFGSVASFVLDEAPKRRTRGQGEYR